MLIGRDVSEPAPKAVAPLEAPALPKAA
jgi:hypothetical protein